MSFADDMSRKSYTQADIDGLKKKYTRTHFTHFSGQTSQKYRDNYDRIFRKPKQERRTRRKSAEVKDDGHT